MTINSLGQNAILTTLRLWAAVSLGLYLLGYFLPEETAWSVWPFTFLPMWLGMPLIACAASTLIPAWNRRLQVAIRHVWQRLPSKERTQFWFVLLALLSMPLFWLARIRHLGWGDAQILVIGLSHPDQTVIYNWQAPLTVFLHQRLWALVAEPYFGWGVETVYAIISVLCGGAFVYIMLNVAQRLGRNTSERALIAGFVLTTGAMQLFFGYVENYTIISLGIMIFLWFGLRVLRDKASVWAASLALAITNALHPSTVVLWPAVLYLVWQRYRAGESILNLLLELTLPPLVIASSVLTLMELGDHGLALFLGDDRPGGGDHVWFVPLLQTRTEFERYTMFSLPHIIEWANEHFLISTFGLPTIAIIAMWALQHRRLLPAMSTETRHRVWFFGLASFGYVLLTWVWNADYGMRKDWDLFGPSAFVYSLWAAFMFTRLLKDKAALAQAALMVIAISGLHTAAWIFANMHPR